MDNLGNRITDLLEVRKMTQRELARKVDISDATMSRYINNKRTPDVVICNNIAKVLGVTVDFLLGKENNPYVMLVGVILRNRNNLNTDQKMQLIKLLVK